MSDCGCGTPGLNPGTNVGNDKVKIDNTDTTEDFLFPKLAAGAGVSLTVLNPGGNEQLQITATGAGSTPHAETFFPINNQTVFNLAATPAVANTTGMFVNGLKATYGVDYTEAAGVVTWLNTDFNMAAGMTVIITYQS